ncbi:hypothetical protein SCP_1400610 [Sparassis crispa]|uniref:Uncharacterized protein n=1 Tax=Sparassis crispa TaxID=139825 RepID=A0A401H2H6_9APHY|nr:hypothetical protein SCP_1400610 [Sparassis crispa]GBE88656.1 hypothetical protein SCP_1400610 [Sparassis crispa]
MLSVLFKQAQATGLPPPPACVSPEPVPGDDGICSAERILSFARNVQREGNFLAVANQYANLVNNQLTRVVYASEGDIKILNALITSLRSCCQQVYIKEANTNADREAASKPLCHVNLATCEQAKKACSALHDVTEALIT